jgi:hypothetical protein
MARRKGRPFIVIDAETDPFKAGRIPQPFIWGCYEGDDSTYREFDTAAALVEYLSDKDVLVYAHNGGRFDFHYLRDFLAPDSPIMVIAGRLAMFKIGKAEFRDSMNILVNPLRAFAKDEIDYKKLEPDVRHLHMDEIRMYLRSDCVYLYNTIARYFNDYGRSMTQAGAAMRYWKKTYKVPFVPQTAGQSERYREFYYGGRVECFVTGHRKVSFKVIDINSAYPRAMQEQHPISPEGRAQSRMPRDKDMPRSFVRFVGTSKGALPFRADDGRLFFPNDKTERTYSVTGWELQTALELDLCSVRKVETAHVFAQTVNFRDYVKHFWDKRIEAKAIGDKAADVFAKLFLNSLYGKWAADPEKYHEYVLAEPESFPRWQRDGYVPILNWGLRILMERPLPEDKHNYYNVATAASITGWVRAYLMRALNQCSGVLYCDTDSIAARDIGSLPLGTKLGEWKHEMDCVEYAIAAKKTYAFRDKVKGQDGKDQWKVASKGVKLTSEEIVRVARGEAVTHAPIVPTYSMFESKPAFTKRIIRRTESDIVLS